MTARHLFSAAICCLFLAAAGGAHALTRSQVQTYLATANKGCSVAADPATVGRIAGSDREVTIVRYGVEGCGGNNIGTTAIAVLYDAGGGRVGSYPLTMTMGGVERYEINASGTLVVHTFEYGPNDPRCCPSRKGTFALAVVDGKLGLPGSGAPGGAQATAAAADYTCPTSLEGHRLLNWKMADGRGDMPVRPTSGTADVTWAWNKASGPVRVVCGYMGTPRTVSLPVAGSASRCVNPEMSATFRCG